MQHKLKNLPYYPWLVFCVTATGTFMATLDSSIVNVALPVVANNLGADLPLVQWVVSAYLLTISSLLPLFGRSGDMFGRKLVYNTGFLVFTVGSVLCGLSSNIWLLVGARIFQALGAAMLMANSPAIVSVAFPGKERGRALGLIGTVVALGSMTGPGLGGLLVGVFGWQAIFYVNIPIGIVAYMLGQLILPKEKPNQQETFDFGGATLFSISMLSLLLVVSHGQEWGWESKTVIAGGATGLAALVAFVRYETTVKQPMIDLTLFRNWPLLAGNLSGLLTFMALFSNIILLPFYLHSVLALTPTQIGLLITPFPLIMAVVAPVSGYLSERTSPVVLTTGGLGIMAGGLLYLANLGEQVGLWQVALGQAIMGLGNGMFQSPNNNSILSSVHPTKLGLVSGINALVRNVGMVTGIAVAVSVFENRLYNALIGITAPTAGQQTAAFLTAYHSALVVGACFAFIGAIISLNRKGHAKLQNG